MVFSLSPWLKVAAESAETYEAKSRGSQQAVGAQCRSPRGVRVTLTRQADPVTVIKQD